MLSTWEQIIYIFFNRSFSLIFDEEKEDIWRLYPIHNLLKLGLLPDVSQFCDKVYCFAKCRMYSIRIPVFGLIFFLQPKSNSRRLHNMIVCDYRVFFSVTGISSPMFQLLSWNSKFKGFFGLYNISNVTVFQRCGPFHSCRWFSYHSPTFETHLDYPMYIILLPVVYFFELFWLQSAYVTRSFTSYVILKTNPGFKGLSFTFQFSFIPVII